MKAASPKALDHVMSWMIHNNIMFRVLSIDQRVNIGDDRGTMFSLPKEYAAQFPTGAFVWAFRNYTQLALASRAGDGEIRVLMMPE